MSRYQLLQNFVNDEEDVAAFEHAEDNYQKSEDNNAPYEALEQAIKANSRAYEQAAATWVQGYALTWVILCCHQEQHPEEYENLEELAGETCAVELSKQVLAEDSTDESCAEEEQNANYGNASPEPSMAADEECSDSGLAGMPPMFDGDCTVASQFIDDWDEWSSTLSVQFSRFQLCAIFLSLFRNPINHWAEQRLLQIRKWRNEGMTDDNDCLLKDIIGRFMEEFVPRDDAREEYVEDAAEDPDDSNDWSTVDREDPNAREVPSPPSLCHDESQDFEEEPDEVEEYVKHLRGDAREEYGCQNEIDKYYYSDKANTVLGRTSTTLEERVHPVPRKQKKRKMHAVKQTPRKRKTVKWSYTKSSPTATWESKYIRRFGKARLQSLHTRGVPDYMIEAKLLPKKKTTTTPYDYDKGQFHNGWTGPETFTRPAAEPASWRGPNTFATPAYQAAPADPTPASWGSAEADTVQESRAAENTGWDEPHCSSWMEEYNNDNDDPMPRAVIPRADNQMPRADSPRVGPSRGRPPTIKPVYGSNMTTYAPTTRQELTSIQHHIVSTDHGTYRVPTLTPDELAKALEDTHINAVSAAEEGEYLQAANLCKRAHILTFPDQLPWQHKEEVLQATISTLEKDMARMAEQYKCKVWKRQQGQLQKLEDDLANALIIGDDKEVQQLDQQAIQLARVLTATDEDRDPEFPVSDTDILIQCGCCSRREGNVTFSPSPTPRTPLAKTPNTVG
ncbi:hypothetical protein EDB86DRAFT_2834847 [Lactarius hatsudake]|nr:hypothetical protein EDB86DRAFT_2834847 [Lactarius hatsudake]